MVAFKDPVISFSQTQLCIILLSDHSRELCKYFLQHEFFSELQASEFCFEF